MAGCCCVPMTPSFPMLSFMPISSHRWLRGDLKTCCHLHLKIRKNVRRKSQGRYNQWKIAGCSPVKEARSIAWATRESALTELGYLWIHCLAKRLASIWLPTGIPWAAAALQPPDLWMLRLWQISKRACPIPPGSNCKSQSRVFLCWPPSRSASSSFRPFSLIQS